MMKVTEIQVIDYDRKTCSEDKIEELDHFVSFVI
jgi:hypothetical protein